MTKVYLSTGSNLNDRLKNLDLAVQYLDEQPEIAVLRSSTVYETEPWGYEDQPVFLNQVVEIETDLTPPELLKRLKQIEKDVGRRPTFKYGPRIMDIDIVFYGNEVYHSENLNIPHPHLGQRAFVLVPLVDLIADFAHPVTGKTVQEMTEEIDTTGIKPFSD